MNKYSKSSQDRLDTCHKDLKRIFNYMLPIFDHSVLCGHRNEAEQERCFMAGLSQCQWPDSKHNSFPAMSIDAAPYDYYVRNVDYKDIERIAYFAGHVMAVASFLFNRGDINHLLIWGGDWDNDTDLKELGKKVFRDRVHFELVVPK